MPKKVKQQSLDVMIVGTASRKALEKAGAIVGTVAGPVTTAILPKGNIDEIRGIPGVSRVEESAGVERCLKISDIEVGADDIWFAASDGAIPFAPPWDGIATGAGVIIGVVDTGCDIANLDFQIAAGNTRILAIWDQTNLAGGGFTPPTGFTYGVEYLKAAIDAGTVPASYKDSDGHGTHITGIAAGSGVATGAVPPFNWPAYRYVGVAPEADIIIVKASTLLIPVGSFVESKIIDACNYIFGKATAAAKPCVILLAMGHRRGSHDGKYPFDIALSNLCEPTTHPGRAIVAAAGNDGGKKFHANIDVPVSGTDTVTFVSPTLGPNNPNSNAYIQIEAWHGLNASFRAKLTSPHGHTTNWVSPGASSGVILTPDCAIRLDNAQVDNGPQPTAKKIFVFLNEVEEGIMPAAGTWTLEFERVTGATSGRLDLWMSGWVLTGTLIPPEFSGSHANSDMLVMSPATAQNVISFGHYCTELEWMNADQQQSLWPPGQTLGALSTESSKGPRRDGEFRPDAIAPGHGVSGGLSKDEQVALQGGNTWMTEDKKHRHRKGSSAAAAHGAGGVALYFENNTLASCEDVREAIRENCAADNFTGITPNGAVGFGKLRFTPTMMGPGLPASQVIFQHNAEYIGTTAFRITPRGGLYLPTSITTITVDCNRSSPPLDITCPVSAISASGFTATPSAEELSPSTLYIITLTAGVQQGSGQAMAQTAIYFMTGTTGLPTSGRIDDVIEIGRPITGLAFLPP